MTKKSFAVILVLSLAANYITLMIDAFVNNTLIAGKSGFPFKYSRSTLFGEGSIDSSMLILNIIFWFLVIWGIWKLAAKKFKK